MPDGAGTTAPDPDGAAAAEGSTSVLVTRREPIVYVADLAGRSIDPADLHHLQRVLRVREGADICLCDGRGSWQLARLHGDRAMLIGAVQMEPAITPTLSVAVALPKGERADWMVQKVTELGIDAIVVINAERSVVRLRHDRAGRAGERFERVIRAAGAQSRRAQLPRLDGPRDLEEIAAGAGVAMAHPGGGPLTPDVQTVLIGPEGGWSSTELGLGLPLVGLGPHVLRVETAALATTTLLVALRSQHVTFACSPRENALGG